MTTQRKKRLRIIQISLLFFGILVLIITYGGTDRNFERKIISRILILIDSVHKGLKLNQQWENAPF